jgi:hypothetical protein
MRIQSAAQQVRELVACGRQLGYGPDELIAMIKAVS